MCLHVSLPALNLIQSLDSRRYSWDDYIGIPVLVLPSRYTQVCACKRAVLPRITKAMTESAALCPYVVEYSADSNGQKLDLPQS